MAARTATTAPTATSATHGTLCLGWTLARACGSSRLDAIANTVRPTPAIRDSSTPSDAIGCGRPDDRRELVQAARLDSGGERRGSVGQTVGTEDQ